MIWCAWNSTVMGRGTPAPIDLPKELVVSRLYRYARNPMYGGAIIMLLGYVFWYPTRAILACPLIFFLGAHLFVVFYEEPHLRKMFCAVYEAYCRSVPRWIPRWKRRD